MLVDPTNRDATAGLRSDAVAAPLLPALRRYARLLGAEPGLAEDLVQEAFVVALRRPDFDASDPRATFAFLRTTVRNLWLRSRRGRVATRELDEADAVWDARCADGGSAYLEALRQCVAALPARSRALLDHTYAAGRTRGAAAAAMGMKEDGIKSALRRLRRALHDCIDRRIRGDER